MINTQQIGPTGPEFPAQKKQEEQPQLTLEQTIDILAAQEIVKQFGESAWSNQTRPVRRAFIRVRNDIRKKIVRRAMHKTLKQK